MMQSGSYFQKENVCFFGINFFLYATNSLYFGFLNSFLLSNGYTGFQAAVISSVSCLVSLFFQPLAGYITDTFLPLKRYLTITCLLGMGTVFALPLFIQTMAGALIGVFVFCLFFTPSAYLVDTWVVSLRDRMPYIDYGKNRLGGSVGYALTAALGGTLVTFFASFMVLYYAVVGCLTLLVIIIRVLPPVPCKNKRTQTQKPGEGQSLGLGAALRELLSNRQYLLFVLSAMVYMTACRPFGTNVAYVIREIGGTDANLGLAIAVSAIFECPVLFIASRFVKKYPLSYIYLCSITCLVIRGVLLCFTASFPVLILSQVFQAFSYGAYMPASLEIVNRVVPERIRATGITLMVGMTVGVGGVLGTLLSGTVIDHLGATSMSGMLTIFAAASVFVYLVPQAKRLRSLI